MRHFYNEILAIASWMYAEVRQTVHYCSHWVALHWLEFTVFAVLSRTSVKKPASVRTSAYGEKGVSFFSFLFTGLQKKKKGTRVHGDRESKHSSVQMLNCQEGCWQTYVLVLLLPIFFHALEFFFLTRVGECDWQLKNSSGRHRKGEDI